MKATFRLGSLQIEVEGDATEVAELAQSLSKRALTGLALNPGAADRGGEGEDGSRNLPKDADEPITPPPADPTERLPDARHFFAEHAPTNNREATAVAAYYLRHVAPADARSSTIDKESLEAVFHEAKWKFPKRLDQTLVDTAGAGYIKRVDTGKYEITNVGHNLVMHTLGPNTASG